MVSSASAEVTMFTRDVHAHPTLRVVRACHPAEHVSKALLVKPAATPGETSKGNVHEQLDLRSHETKG